MSSNENTAPTLDTDVCIVGTGPAGATVAQKLLEAGLTVVQLESGIDEPDDAYQALATVESKAQPLRPNFISRMRMVGGSSNLWPGRCMPFEPIDFEQRGWVPNSGWPIAHSEYRKYLPEAAKVLEIPVKELMSYLDAPKHKLQDLDETRFSLKVGLWGKGAKRFRENIDSLCKTYSKYTLMTGQTLTDFQFDSNTQRLESVTARTLDGTATVVKARQFVFAMGGMENARALLLLEQKNADITLPCSDNIGRFFMEHPRCVAGEIKLNEGVDWSHLLGHPVAGGIRQFGLGLSDSKQRQSGALNAYCYLEPYTSEAVAKSYDATIQSLKRVLKKGHTGSRLDFSDMESVKGMVYQLTPKEILPNWLYRIYYSLRGLIKPHKRHLIVVNHCEQAPLRDSRLTLGEAKDQFGNPLLDVYWQISQPDLDAVKQLHDQLNEWVSENGYGTFIANDQIADKRNYEDASHHIGTTRMAATSDDGVVDTQCRVFGTKNLFMAGSSVFPTSGSGNPTLSIVAFSLRLAEHLISGKQTKTDGTSV